MSLNYTVQVDAVTTGEWSTLLHGFCDSNLYQTWGYGEATWGRHQLSHLTITARGVVVGMAQLRVVYSPVLETGIAHLLWGPLFHRRCSPPNREVLCWLADAIRREYADKRGLLLRVVPNGVVDSLRGTFFMSAFRDYRQTSHGHRTERTFIIPLSRPTEDLRRSLDKKWRNQLRQAECGNLTVTRASTPGQFAAFVPVYGEMLMRKAFDTSVNIDVFARVQTLLTEDLRPQVFLCYDSGVPVAGAVVDVSGTTARYVLGATTDTGLRLRASYLLQWEILKWLREREVVEYDLGGIDPKRNPGVHHFKKGLGGEEVCYLPPFVACNGKFTQAVLTCAEELHRTLQTSVRRVRRVWRDAVRGKRAH